jgi:drug/metabolite transporter (DMT)-like permease
MRLSANMKGMLFSGLGFSSWATGDAAIKYLTAYYSNAAIIFWNALFLIVLYFAVAPWLGGLKATFRSRKIKLHLLRGALLTAQIYLVVYGFSQMTLAKTYAIVFSAPFMAILLSIPLLHEKISVRQWIATAVGFAGVLVVLRPGVIPVDGAALCVLAGALVFSLMNLTVRFIEKPHENNETIISWGLLPELVIVSISFLVLLPQWVFPAPEHLLLFVFLAATSGIGMVLIAYAFRISSPAVAAPFQYVQILWGVTLGYILFADTLDLWVGAGAAVIIASGLWLIWHEKNDTAKAVHPLPPP